MSPSATRSSDDDRWRAWAADGVRHRILLRVLPIQRHDVLGPLSVLRMGLAVLKRRAADAASDAADLQRRIGEADVQVGEAVRMVAALRQWDAASARPQAWAELAAQALRLVQTAASMGGHRVEPLEAADPGPGLRLDEAEAARLPYLLLGLLMHLQDTAPGPRLWRPRLLADGLQLGLEPLAGAGGGDGAALPALPSAQMIDAQALDLLLVDSGWVLARTDRGALTEVRLQRPG
ncbi:MAG: hypothetical protein RLY78_96 [Pseudomonadota bacterium]|jgi:hypothetical protein